MRAVNRPHVVIAALSVILPLAGLAVAAAVLPRPPDGGGHQAATTCPHCGRVVGVP